MGKEQGLSEEKNAAGNFGELKLGGVKAFWSMDSKMEKTYFAADTRGLFIGNDAALLEKALESKTIAETGTPSYVKSAMPENIFFFAYIDREGFFGPIVSIVQALMSGQPGAQAMLGRIGDISIAGRKTGGHLSFEADVEIEKGDQ